MSNNLLIDTIYSYSNHSNVPWIISEYQPKKQYLDSEKIKQESNRKLRNYKRSIDNNIPISQVPEKKFFIDEQIKPFKANPSPNKYQQKSQFDQTKNKEKSKTIKINPRLKKFTYLDIIQRDAKINKKPSVGKYNIDRTQKQLKQQMLIYNNKKSNIQQKRHFYDGAETRTLDIPGSGFYNPHLQINIPSKPSRKDHKWWIQKHRTLSLTQRKKKSKQPAPTSYRPVSASFNLFDKIQLDFKKFLKKNKGKKMNKSLGFTSSDSKFQYTRQSKVKIKQKRPASTSYNTIIQWKGKKQQIKINNWIRCLSAGPTKRLYS